MEIVKAMIEKAKTGDAVAARPILERIWPARKGALLEFELPEIAEAKDIPLAIAGINRQVADGEISPDEGVLIVGLLDAHRKAIETNELVARIEALEARIK